MHNVFQIGIVVRREALTITLLVEGCTNLKNIVHFYGIARDKVLHTGRPEKAPHANPQTKKKVLTFHPCFF